MTQCARCSEKFLPLPPKLVEKIYGKEGDKKGLTRICPDCRRRAAWESVVVKR